MPLTKLLFQPGFNKEITALSAKGTWVDGDKVRFRQGFPEKIGGWARVSSNSYKGVCRALIEWASLGGATVHGVGTHLKYYVLRGGQYYDVTPIVRTTAAGGVTFAATNGSAVITVTDTSHGAKAGDFVTYSGAASLGGAITAMVLNREYAVTEVLSVNTYTVTTSVVANASDVGNGGASTVGAYQLPIGQEINTPAFGWGAGPWGAGPWGVGAPGVGAMRLWNHAGYGEDLIIGPRYGRLYTWDQSAGVSTRAVEITGTEVPTTHIALLVSDVSRFVMAFGCNELGGGILDPMLVRWSDQENFAQWMPSIVNQAGGLRLSKGTRIITARQARQEVLVWTDSALYSMQYQGPPLVWGAQLVGESSSLVAPNAVAMTNGVAFWMGADTFYRYDGRVQPMRCDVRKHVFSRLNYDQADQICCGLNEAFNEVWWHYPTNDSTTNTDYVVYNFADDVWYTGTMSRTAWIASVAFQRPLAATNGALVEHETGTNDRAGMNAQPIHSYILSADTDIGDGDRFSFVWRMLPDISFAGSSAANPQVMLELRPQRSSGQGLQQPPSVGGQAVRDVTRTATVPVEQYTHQVNIRVRGRQLALKVESTELGVQWQLGTPRLELRPDGRRA
jgi:hypothetical protein